MKNEQYNKNGTVSVRVSSGRHRDAGVGVIAIAAALFLRERIFNDSIFINIVLAHIRSETLVLIFSSFSFRTMSSTFLPL